MQMRGAFNFKRRLLSWVWGTKKRGGLVESLGSDSGCPFFSRVTLNNLDVRNCGAAVAGVPVRVVMRFYFVWLSTIWMSRTAVPWLLEYWCEVQYASVSHSITRMSGATERDRCRWSTGASRAALFVLKFPSCHTQRSGCSELRGRSC